jgi:hypothetical protein
MALKPTSRIGASFSSCGMLWFGAIYWWCSAGWLSAGVSRTYSQTHDTAGKGGCCEVGGWFRWGVAVGNDVFPGARIPARDTAR